LATVSWIGLAPDQAVAFHAPQGVGHGRLFDADLLAQLALGLPVHLEQCEQLSELPGYDAEWRDLLVKCLGEQPGCVVDLVTQRAVASERLSSVGGHLGAPWRARRRILGHCHMATPEIARRGSSSQRTARVSGACASGPA
jgi:hypothetical protein